MYKLYLVLVLTLSMTGCNKMNDSEIKQMLENDLRNIIGNSLGAIPPKNGIEHMLNYYNQKKYLDAEKEADGDMLLFQYGIYDWGEGKHFEYDITRQVIFNSPSRTDDDSIFQISLTYRFSPEKYSSLISSNKWSTEFNNSTNEFKNYINNSIATEMVKGEQPIEVILSVEQP
jgi:hypothetical protein